MIKILFLILFYCCAASCDVVDITAPEVTDVSPRHGVSVEKDAVITLKFSESMDAKSVDKNFSLSSGNGVEKGEFQWNRKKTQCTFTPQLSLKNGVSYGIALDRGAKDSSGNSVKSRHYSTFTIGVDLTPPTIVSSVPEHNSTTFPLNNTIEVEFSEAMDKMSVERNLRIMPSVEGTFTWPTASKIVFTPHKPLEFNTDYSVIIPVECSDAAGNRLINRTEVCFTAGEEFVKPYVERISAEVTTQNDNWLDSGNYSTIHGIDRESSITFIFSEGVNRDSFKNSLKIFPGTELRFFWKDNRTCEVSAVNGFIPMNEYELRIIPGTVDFAGNEMEQTVINTFVIDAPGSQPPEIISVSLKKVHDNYTYCDLLQNQSQVNYLEDSIGDEKQALIVVKFSKPVDVISFYDNVSIVYQYGSWSNAVGKEKSFIWNLEETEVKILVTSLMNNNCYSFKIQGEDGGMVSSDNIFLQESFESYFYFNGNP